MHADQICASSCKGINLIDDHVGHVRHLYGPHLLAAVPTRSPCSSMQLWQDLVMLGPYRAPLKSIPYCAIPMSPSQSVHLETEQCFPIWASVLRQRIARPIHPFSKMLAGSYPVTLGLCLTMWCPSPNLEPKQCEPGRHLRMMFPLAKVEMRNLLVDQLRCMLHQQKSPEKSEHSIRSQRQAWSWPTVAPFVELYRSIRKEWRPNLFRPCKMASAVSTSYSKQLPSTMSGWLRTLNKSVLPSIKEVEVRDELVENSQLGFNSPLTFL